VNTADTGFVEALRDADRERLHAFPKADRHCHSLLGASLQSIAAWAGKPLRAAPHRMDGLDEMRSYAHSELYPYIRNRAGFEFTADRTIVEAIQDGVSVLEMSLDSDLSRLYELGTAGFVGFVKKLADAHRGSIDFRPELGVSKNRDPSPQIKLARECIESGLFKSIDLYGNEHRQHPEAYRDLFREAKRQGLKLKAHVGEFGDAVLVQRTLLVLDLDEIQHGTAAAASEPIMDLIKDRGIRLNVCPTSNVVLSAARDLKHHPIRTLARNGIRVTINSDDKTIFGMSVSDEYLALFQEGTLTAEELEAIRIESLADSPGPRG
jgi:adenosine deaminase